MDRTKNRKNRLIERGKVCCARTVRFDPLFEKSVHDLVTLCGFTGVSEVLYDAVYSKMNALTKSKSFSTIDNMLEKEHTENIEIANAFKGLRETLAEYQIPDRSK